MKVDERTYTLTEIKRAFWATFHKSGELWFPYRGPDDHCDRATESSWEQFKQGLPDRHEAREI
jgi:hypothetical protein